MRQPRFFFFFPHILTFFSFFPFSLTPGVSFQKVIVGWILKIDKRWDEREREEEMETAMMK